MASHDRDVVQKARLRRAELQAEIDKIDTFLAVYDKFKGDEPHGGVVANAVRVMRIATGQDEAAPSPAGATLGRRGGKARAAKLTPERRSEIARNAAAKRWS